MKMMSVYYNKAEARKRVLLLLLAGTLAGCPLFAQNTSSAPPPQSVTVSYTMPVLSLVEAGAETQEQGSVVAKMTPPGFAADRVITTKCRQLPALMVVNNQYSYEVVRTPVFVVRPSFIEFKVKITNKLPRVLKLEGTIIKFTVNGEERTISSDGYKEFLAGVLLPNQEKEFAIQGPEWKTLSNDTVLSLSLYDMCINMDKAGVVTEKGNFEWNFRYTTEQKSSEDSVETEEVQMTPDMATAQCQ